eukprot:TRINITY_DN30540_c0_g1_i1.p1 TRINITY_DN30540_c0_g1~~TRINITY_DN30540_c0_g1_i1.p1  ORF type:complete len:317 (+),score=89.62 TRINITY_DN30540_c0_g1_i1:78-953(+)
MSLQVTIPAAVIMYADGNHHITYKVECRWVQQNFRSYRRYREFRQFDIRCRSASCTTSRPCLFARKSERPALPWRWLLGFLRDPRRVRARRIALESYIQGLSHAGLCTRHKAMLDEFLLPQATLLPALDSPEAVRDAEETRADRSFHLASTPPGLECYGDLDIQFGQHCLLTVRDTAMNVLLQTPRKMEQRWQRGASRQFAGAFRDHFTANRFPKNAFQHFEDPVAAAAGGIDPFSMSPDGREMSPRRDEPVLLGYSMPSYPQEAAAAVAGEGIQQLQQPLLSESPPPEAS